MFFNAMHWSHVLDRNGKYYRTQEKIEEAQ